MVASKTLILAGIIAYVEARFGQEQVPAPAISALGNFGNPGEAATLAGKVPSALLAGASACDKLSLADEIVATLGDDPAVIEAALALVAAEMNFNPFADATGRICNDPSLPATAALRGVIPQFDPAVAGSDVQNANSAQSLQTPFNADGLSVADISRAQGFSNFNEQDAAGAVTQTAVEDGAAAVDDDAAAEEEEEEEVVEEDPAQVCQVVEVDEEEEVEEVDEQDEADDAEADVDAGEAAELQALQGQFGAIEVAADANFGTCDLTIQRLPNTEFANRQNENGLFFFQASDPIIADGQQEALNGNIIINRVCDDLINECGGNSAAQAACDEVQAAVDASNIGNNSPLLADAFNAGIAAITA